MRKQFAVLTLVSMLPLGVSAAEASSGALDLYFVPSAGFDIDIPGFGSGDDDGDGFGAKALFPVGESTAMNLEYQSTSYDDSGIDVDQVRLGFGFIGPSTSGAFLEYAKIDLDGSEADGFGLHGRLAGDPSENVQFYADIGYMTLNDDTEDISGLEYTFGGAVAISPKFGVFGDYRVTDLEGKDSNVKFKFSDLRVGIRIGFGQ